MLVEIFDDRVAISPRQIVDTCEIGDVLVAEFEEILAPQQLLLSEVAARLWRSIGGKALGRLPLFHVTHPRKDVAPACQGITMVEKSRTKCRLPDTRKVFLTVDSAYSDEPQHPAYACINAILDSQGGTLASMTAAPPCSRRACTYA